MDTHRLQHRWNGGCCSRLGLHLNNRGESAPRPAGRFPNGRPRPVFARSVRVVDEWLTLGYQHGHVDHLGQTGAHVPDWTPHAQADDMYGERVVPYAMRLPSLEEDTTVHGRPKGKVNQNVTGD